MDPNEWLSGLFAGQPVLTLLRAQPVLTLFVILGLGYIGNLRRCERAAHHRGEREPAVLMGAAGSC